MKKALKSATQRKLNSYLNAWLKKLIIININPVLMNTTNVTEQDSYVMKTASADVQSYTIPLRYRKMENLHIVFWLFKDISWCLVWKPLGIVMILPTLIISFIIAWRTRKYVSELCHNLAISVWISANSYWMISEFFGFDADVVVGSVTYKHLAMIPFCIGVIILGYYYLYFKPKHKGEAETM